MPALFNKKDYKEMSSAVRFLAVDMIEKAKEMYRKLWQEKRLKNEESK